MTLAPLLLVAEDDDAFRTLLVVQLLKAKFRVEEVRDGAQLLSRLARAPKPDLLLTDVRMPWLEGIDALALADTAGVWLPTLILTSFPNEQLQERARTLEAEVLSKPVKMEQLLVAIARMLRRHAVLLDGAALEGFDEIRPITTSTRPDKPPPASPGTASASPATSRSGWLGAPRIVLLAEDDDELRELLANELSRDGHGVVAARDGESLLSALAGLRRAGRNADVVVTDFRMPNRSGLDVARWVAEHCSASRVVMISAFATEALQQQAREAGVAHVLAKPFDADDLRTVVLHVMR